MHKIIDNNMFQHTAARRRLGCYCRLVHNLCRVSTHSRPKAAGSDNTPDKKGLTVSTHSRPKAAGSPARPVRPTSACFNTQPPEGGWKDVN